MADTTSKTFAENVNHVAELDNSLGYELELRRSNVVLKAGSTYTAETEIRIFSRATNKTESLVVGPSSVTSTGLNAYLAAIKTALELAYPQCVMTHSVVQTTSALGTFNNVQLAVVLSGNDYYLRSVNLKISEEDGIQYNIDGQLVEPLEVTPSLVAITAEVISEINVVVANEANISSVAANEANINTLTASLANVNTIASIQNLANMTTVANDLNAMDLNGIADVTVVANNLVLGNASSINIVSANKANIDAVADNKSNIDAVAANEANINAVVDAAISTAADVLLTHADVVLTHADVASTNADVVTSTTQAGIATTKAGEASASAASASTSASTATTAATTATTKAGEASASAASAASSANAGIGIISNNQNINLLTTGGRYGCIGTPTNGAVAGECYVEVMTDGSRVMQVATYANGDSYVRVYSGSWGAWTKHGHADLQPLDATLTALAGVTTSADKYIYATASDTFTTGTITAFGRSLVDDADAATARTTLGLASGATTTVGTIATQSANAVSITGGTITGITDLAVADGGTGASDAATARTNLGVAIGTNVQAYDAGLQSIAGLTTSADKMIYTTASDTYAVTTLTAAGRALIDDVDAAAQRTTLGISATNTPSTAVGGISATNVQSALQELDSEKANIASPTFTGTVGGITKAMVGLGNVDNTSDVNKPVSTATQTALNLKVSKDSDTGAAYIPSGTTAQRPSSPSVGYLRFNTEIGQAEMWNGTAWSPVGGGANGVTKIDLPTKVNATSINVNGVVLDLNTNLIVPYSKTAGTDYYFTSSYITGDKNDVNVLGGFHYGVIPEAFTAINNITTVDATDIRGINKYSIWTKWYLPTNKDPRGMIRHLNGRWYDIYLLNTDHHLYGTSAAGKTIAGGAVNNGRNYPKIPLFYGGDGSVTYGTLTWFEAAEIGKAYGKDMISYEEFVAIAYGVKEASSAGAADTGITQHLADYTSKFGVCMATGCEYIWGKDLIGAAGAAWNTNTEGRGSIYNGSLIGVLFGGARDITVESGSRCSLWSNTVWNTHWTLGCRYACNHLELA